jgi:hypothetical protein
VQINRSYNFISSPRGMVGVDLFTNLTASQRSRLWVSGLLIRLTEQMLVEPQSLESDPNRANMRAYNNIKNPVIAATAFEEPPQVL